MEKLYPVTLARLLMGHRIKDRIRSQECCTGSTWWSDPNLSADVCSAIGTHVWTSHRDSLGLSACCALAEFLPRSLHKRARVTNISRLAGSLRCVRLFICDVFSALCFLSWRFCVASMRHVLNRPPTLRLTDSIIRDTCIKMCCRSLILLASDMARLAR